MKDLALEYANKPEGWFFIGGQTGAGKTHICVAIVQRLIERSGKMEYFRWVDDSKRLKAIANEQTREEELKRYKEADILYIDDFLKIAPTEADRALAFEIINGAYAIGQRLIISSEKTLHEIDCWDGAIAGRIRERAGKYWATLTGAEKNYRAK